MRSRSLLAVAVLFAATILPAQASARWVAYANYDGYTNMRAGPSTRYPVIARLYPGTRVDVLGCLETRAWCDVIIDDLRGWVYAKRLEFVYAGRRVLVPDYYSYFGAPFVIFRFDDRDRRDRHRRDRDRTSYDKTILGHPGGGGPGPEEPIPPLEDTNGTDGQEYFGHPGDGGPGPVDIGRDDGMYTEEVLPDGVGPDGSGGVCPSGDPNCIEGTQ